MDAAVKLMLQRLLIFLLPVLVILGTAMLVSGDSLGIAGDSGTGSHGSGCSRPHP